MTISRASAEAIIIRRIGRWFTAVGLDGATDDGTNVDLADPIAWAIRQSSGTVTNAVIPADVDLATASSVDRLLDFAEYRALLNAYQNYTKVDVEGLVGKVKLDQLRQGLKDAITLKRSQLVTEYDFSSGGSFTQVTATYGVTIADEFARPPDYWP